MNYLFVDKFDLKDEATSGVEKKKIFNERNFPAGIHMRDDASTTESGIVY